MASQKDVDLIRDKITQVLAVRPDGEQFGLLKNDGKFLYQWAYKAIRRLDNCDLSDMPQNSIDAIKKFVDGVASAAAIIKDLQSHPQQRDTVSNNLGAASILFHGQVHGMNEPLKCGGIAQIISYYSSDLEPLARDAKSNLQLTREYCDAAAKARKETEETRNAAKQAANEIAVATFADSFNQQAKDDEETAKWWFSATCAVAATTLGTTVALFFQYKSAWLRAIERENAAFPTSLAVGGVAIISVLFFALFLCARMYRANIHNAALNRHRRNALNTFTAFMAGAEDPAAKAAILNFAAQAIFTPQPTGFMAGRDGEMVGPQSVVAMFPGAKDGG